VWEGRYYEPVLVAGKLKKVRRTVVLGLCSGVTKSGAKRRFQEILRPLNEGLYSPAQAMTFADFCARWKKDILENYRASTRGFYDGTLDRWIIPYFGDWSLGEIKTPDIQRFVNRFGDYSGSVLKHLRAIMGCVFSTAVDWEYLVRSPVSGLKLPHGKPVERARVLSPEEIRLLISHLVEPYRTMVILMVGTAIRQSELLALKWTDFDWAERTITIRRFLYRGKLGPTKSAKGSREIPFGGKVGEAVLVLKGSPHNRDEFLFLTARGKIYNPRVVERLGFTPLIEALKLAPFSSRSFRRSGATALHVNNVPLRVQQEILGHSNPEMSLRYTEAELAYCRSAINLLEEAVFGGNNKVNLLDANGRDLGLRIRSGRAKELILKKAPVAQLDRAADFESVGRGFESLQARHTSFGSPCRV